MKPIKNICTTLFTTGDTVSKWFTVYTEIVSNISCKNEQTSNTENHLEDLFLFPDDEKYRIAINNIKTTHEICVLYIQSLTFR